MSSQTEKFSFPLKIFQFQNVKNSCSRIPQAPYRVSNHKNG